MPFDDIEHLSKLGIVGILILLLMLLYMGKLRWGRDYEKMEADYEKLEADRDRWMRAAFKSTEVARRQVRVLDKTTPAKTEAADEPDTDG